MKKHVFFTLYLIFIAYSSLFPKSVSAKKNADTLLNQGVSFYNQGSYEDAITCFLEVVKHASEQKKIITLCKAYNNLGNCYSYTSDLKSALANYQNALRIAEQLKDSTTIAKCTKNIGAMYSESGDFKTAMMYYNKSEQLSKKLKNNFLIADCYNNKAVIYEQEKKYETALTYYQNALTIYKEENNKERLALSYNNIGIVYKYQKQYALSISFYEKSIELSKQLNDSFLVSANLNNLANVYSLTGNHVKAKQLLFEAIEMAKKIHQSQVLIEALDGISEEYNLLGDSKLAYKYRKEFEFEKFNYINTERTKQLADMEVKYETEKKETEIKILKQNEEIKSLQIEEKDVLLQKRKYLLATSLVIITLLIFVGYFYFSSQKIKSLRKQEQAIRETEENERLRMAKDIHDDLGSGLSKIKFLTELVANKSANNPEITSSIKSISE